jgi:hypothetical protein
LGLRKSVCSLRQHGTFLLCSSFFAPQGKIELQSVLGNHMLYIGWSAARLRRAALQPRFSRGRQSRPRTPTIQNVFAQGKKNCKE